MPRQAREQLSIVCWCFAKHDLNLLIYAPFTKLGFRQSFKPTLTLVSFVADLLRHFPGFLLSSPDQVWCWARRLNGVFPQLRRQRNVSAVTATGSGLRLLCLRECKQEQSVVSWLRGTPWYTVVQSGTTLLLGLVLAWWRRPTWATSHCRVLWWLLTLWSLTQGNWALNMRS